MESAAIFERYTEKARRCIFFARYEASQYGSPYIETEHLLLGILREDSVLKKYLLEIKTSSEEIREEIDKKIEKGERISTAIEVPLTEECKKILKLAAEEANSLGSSYIDPVHLLLGILRVENCLAARILRERGVKTAALHEKFLEGPALASAHVHQDTGPVMTLESFLAGLRSRNASGFADFFASNGQFIDSEGKQWAGRAEIEKGFTTLFAPYAKRKASFIVEDVRKGPSGVAVATLLWENAVGSGEHSVSILRMSLVLVREGDDWAILLAQATPIPVP